MTMMREIFGQNSFHKTQKFKYLFTVYMNPNSLSSSFVQSSMRFHFEKLSTLMEPQLLSLIKLLLSLESFESVEELNVSLEVLRFSSIFGRVLPFLPFKAFFKSSLLIFRVDVGFSFLSFRETFLMCVLRLRVAQLLSFFMLVPRFIIQLLF